MAFINPRAQTSNLGCREALSQNPTKNSSAFPWPSRNLEVHGHPWTFSSLDHTSLLPHPKPLPFPQMTQSRPASCGQHILGGSPGAGCVTLQEPSLPPHSDPPTLFRPLFLKHPAWKPDVHSWAAIPAPVVVKQPWGSRAGDFQSPVRRACWRFPLVPLALSSPWSGGRCCMTTSQPTLHPHPSSPEGKSDTQIQLGKRRKWEQREGKSFPVKRKEGG